jgi:hypothetical protein
MTSRIGVMRGDAFRGNPAVRSEIAAIVAPSYIEGDSRLDSEIDHCDTLYVSRDERGELISFFMTALGSLDVGGRIVPALYTGLCATRQDRKNCGRIVKLINYCMYESQEWQRQERRKLAIWGTTASPSVYLIIQSVFANVRPRLDGGYCPDSAEIARGVQRRFGRDLAADSHPFVLPRFATGVRYTDLERTRIAAVCRSKRFSLYTDLGIEEARGDRLLFVAEVPEVLWCRVEGYS